MPGIDLTSSSAVSRPPSRLEIVPPVATRRTRGRTVAACCDADAARAGCDCGQADGEPARMASTAKIRRMSCFELSGPGSAGGGRNGAVKRIQIPVEERPHAIPRVTLLSRVLGLPGLRIDAPIERMPAWRVVVDHCFGELWLARAQRVDELHVFFDVDVLIVSSDPDVQRDLQLVDVVQRRAILVDLR